MFSEKLGKKLIRNIKGGKLRKITKLFAGSIDFETHHGTESIKVDKNSITKFVRKRGKLFQYFFGTEANTPNFKVSVAEYLRRASHISYHPCLERGNYIFNACVSATFDYQNDDETESAGIVLFLKCKYQQRKCKLDVVAEIDD